MSFDRIIELLKQNLLIIIFFTLFVTFLGYYLTRDLKKTYTVSSMYFTGFTSGLDYDETSGNRYFIKGLGGITAREQSSYANMIQLMQSDAVLEEVAMRLMAQHLSQEHHLNDRICSKYALEILHRSLPEEFRDEITVKNDIDSTYTRIKRFYDGEPNNLIYRLVHADVRYATIPFYSLPYLRSIRSYRLPKSDMIYSTYTCVDPAIAYYTLVFFNKIILAEMLEETSNKRAKVTQFFEDQMNTIESKLKKVETDLLDYCSDNKILDYKDQVQNFINRKNNVKQEINKEVIALAAFDVSRLYTENQLDMHVDVLSANAIIISNRKKLEEIAKKIALSKLDDDQVPKDSVLILEQDLNLIRKGMRDDLDAIYEVNYSTSGIKAEKLLDEWFDCVLNIGESKARLHILNEQYLYFDELYNTWAPIGSTIAKMEREVKMYENMYLESMRFLNQSKMSLNDSRKEEDVIKTPPVYPFFADPSPRKRILILCFILGFVLIVSIVLFMEALNSKIRTLNRLKDVSGLLVSTGYPHFNENKRYKVKNGMIKEVLTRRLVEKVQQSFLTTNQKSSKTKIIAVSSMYSKEGKSFVARELSSILNDLGSKVMLCQYQSNDDNVPLYLSNDEFSNKSLKELIYDLSDMDLSTTLETLIGDYTHFDYIIVELPSLYRYQTSISILQQVDINLLVFNAQRSWNNSDTDLLERFKGMISNEPLAFLNFMEFGFANQLVGDLNRKSNKVVELLSRLIRIK
ncbi:MAG: hypothetical protein MK207_14805 [Saprospiraceae bacterium]|nr:hypothetical protein [Saprospiraceae bacterium]